MVLPKSHFYWVLLLFLYTEVQVEVYSCSCQNNLSIFRNCEGLIVDGRISLFKCPSGRKVFSNFVCPAECCDQNINCSANVLRCGFRSLDETSKALSSKGHWDRGKFEREKKLEYWFAGQKLSLCILMCDKAHTNISF